MAGRLVKLAAFGVLLFVLLELSARVVVFGPRGLDPRRVGIFQDRAPSSLVTYETDRRMLFEYRPNLDVFFKAVRFRTNSAGMRDQEYSLAKPPDTFRVAVVGSSFTLPAGVEIEDSYHSLLEERFNREFAPKKYEFLNFAIGLHGASQILATLRHKALRYEPNLILFSLTSMSAPGMLLAWDRLPPAKMLRVVEPAGVRSYFAQLVRSRLKRESSVSSGPPPFPNPLAGPRDVVSRLARLSRELGIPVVVVRIELDSREATRAERLLEEKVRAEGMFYVDTRSAFQGLNVRDMWIYELDPHPNAAAHAIIADVIADSLRSHELVQGTGQTDRVGR